MESITAKYLMPTTRYAYALPHKKMKFSVSPFRRCSYCSIVFCKKSDFQDFQGYAKPVQLLPAQEAKAYLNTTSAVEPSRNLEEFESLYKIQLLTSLSYGSGLNNHNAGLLICIIDENGYSILQRLPACSDNLEDPAQSSNGLASDVIHFQRGSTDDFVFHGPKFGKVQAVWISVESGSRWRLGGAKLKIVSSCEPQVGNSEVDKSDYTSIDYSFEVKEDILVGEGCDNSMIELRPSLVTQSSGVASLLFEDKVTTSVTNEESMKEYTDLKFSLLLYDAMLIIAGTCVASSTAGENTALAFLTGGVGGFLYLLLLQRSVDKLPAPVLNSIEERGNKGENLLFGRLKGPVLVLAFSLGFAALIAKRSGLLDVEPVLTPRDLLFGMMGFLVCKAAVLLAAFKPLSIKTTNDV